MGCATIIGSGPAGLSLAHFLTQRGTSCTIISADDGPGGLARPVAFAGRSVDPGPHSFYSSYDPLSFGVLRSCFREDELHSLVPCRAVRTARFLAHMPLRATDLLQLRFITDATVITAQRPRPGDTIASANARERVLHTRGRRFLDVFFEPWCLKHFGVRAEQLDASLVHLLAAERRTGGAGRIIHPRAGTIGELWSRLAQKLQEHGVSFRWKTRVSGLHVDHERVVGMHINGATERLDGPLFSSAPLGTTAHWLGLDATTPPMRSTILLFMLVDRYRTDALHLTDHRPSEAIGRITFCDNWRAPRPTKGPLVVCAEFWCSPGDGVHDLPAEGLVKEARRYLQRSGVAVPAVSTEHRIIGPVPTTPVPIVGHAALVTRLRSLITGIADLHPMGRHADHRWDGIDDAIREAHALATTHANA